MQQYSWCANLAAAASKFMLTGESCGLASLASPKKKVQPAHALACIFGLDSPNGLWAMALQFFDQFFESLGWIGPLTLNLWAG